MISRRLLLVLVTSVMLLSVLHGYCFAEESKVDVDTLLKMLADPKPFSKEQLKEGATLLGATLRDLPNDDPLLIKLNDARNAIIPSVKTPISDAVRRASLNIEARQISKTPVDEVTAHRTAEIAYGKIPEDAKRVSKSILVDTTKTLRQATGLYVVPGEIVTVIVPDSAVKKGLSIRVNHSSNNLHAAKSLRRMPDGVSRVFAIDEKTIKIANAYGGAISIGRTGKPMASTVPPFRLEIAGAIESPLFVMGSTTDVEWVNSIRNMPGPYAELVSDHTHISLPSEYIRQLDSPTEVLLFWDEVISMQDYMGGHEHLRTHPQMIHIDWTFHNWLHAGYPVMGIPGNPAKNLVNIEFMRKKGDWGWFHELGHEAQRRPDIAWPWNNCYTFSSVEVTVNIFSSYVAAHMVTDFTDGWAWVTSPTKVAKSAQSYLTKAKSAEKPNVSAQLQFYMQLRDGFGWDALSNAIRSYVQQDQTKLPKTKQEKIDQWLINMSHASKHNLTRFMADVWQQPLGDEAVKAVSHLPDWMIASGGIDAVKTESGEPVIIELQKELITFDEKPASITAVSKPENGTITDNADGTWTYTPKADYYGSDAFTYTVASSTGHTFPTEVTVTVEQVVTDKKSDAASQTKT